MEEHGMGGGHYYDHHTPQVTLAV